MDWNKRRLKLAVNKVRNLPPYPALKKYLMNKTAFRLAVRKHSPVLPYPTSLMLELTNHCQLKCITCAREYQFGSEMNVGNMISQSAYKLLDEVLPYLDKIGLTGLGEPLIYGSILSIADYIREKNPGIAMFISTNAQLPDTPGLIDKLADKIDTIQISIDGMGQVFEQVRLRSDFSVFAQNVREIVRICSGRRASPKLNMVVFSKNYHQMTEVIEFAAEMGIRELSFNTINLVANELDLSEYELYESSDFKKELEKAEIRAKLLRIFTEFPKMSNEKGFRGCPYMWNHFYVTWDGYLAVCCAKPFPKEKHFGNAFQSGFLSCINHNEFQKFRVMAAENQAPDYCSRCHYLI